MYPVPTLDEFSKADGFAMLDMFDEMEYDKINDLVTEPPFCSLKTTQNEK